MKTGDEGIRCGLVFNCLKHGACLMERSVTGSLFVLGITYEVLQGSNLMVARSSLATENDDGRLKTHTKIARLATNLLENRSGQMKVMALKTRKKG